jgi:hypothetical protein
VVGCPYFLLGKLYCNQDFGSSGISMCDADLDGDEDILYTNGDAFDYIPPQGHPWHGVNMLENKGNMQYIKHEISKNPTHLLCCEPGDFNNDGLIDLVTGGTHTYPPYDRMGRITLWINNGKLSEKK